MLFSSIEFLYYFLPIVIALYFIAPMARGRADGADHIARRSDPKYRNLVLLAASLVFYGWGEPRYLILMAFQVFSGWFFGLGIERFRGKRASKAALVAALVVGLGGLGYFKYTDFFIANVNTLFGSSFPLPRIALPIGISFYTFQILSYDIDLYRGRTELQRSPLTFAAYVTLFPQLIAGPIVRYADVARELGSREHSIERFARGARRFVLGLGKKVLIANVLGELTDICRASGEKSVLMAWLYIVSYAFHLYFDFSGYSDMAIGLGRIFGFEFMENFNYPYISKSVTEFWRRWHISLSSWFRDYVYIPLGGNRVGPARHIFNILVVWFLTGFWHGAGWSFIAWGGYFAALLLIEKFLLGRLLEKMPSFVSHIYLIVLILFGWTLFDAPDIPEALHRVGLMFGAGSGGIAGGDSLYYLRSYALPLALALVGSTPLPSKAAAAIERRAAKIMTVMEPLTVAALLAVITAYLVDGSFNPFIYFRF
ncbi:MAG: MBOAT family protein [Oscillospiraceae bacterium]|jgi:alginate O-acetyltransferase complex protein AlgI|nr:MBOAT family protein [Oscillospiraceae bacterium]